MAVPVATSTPVSPGAGTEQSKEAAGKTVSLGDSAGEKEPQDRVWPIHHLSGEFPAENSGLNYKAVDALPDGEVEIAHAMLDANKADLESFSEPIARNDETPRPVYTRGPPDYSCPLLECPSPRESRANIKPVRNILGVGPSPFILFLSCSQLVSGLETSFCRRSTGLSASPVTSSALWSTPRCWWTETGCSARETRRTTSSTLARSPS